MPIGLNEGNIGRSVCPGFGKSTYGASLNRTENDTEHKIYLYLDTIMIRTECGLEFYTILSDNFDRSARLRENTI